MNILIVEDQFRDMEYICRTLGEIAPNAGLIKAGDTKSALELLCSNQVDLVFIDIDLPDESGFAFAGKLRENPEYRLLNIVFVTGTRENPLKAHREYHCYDFIKKPYTKAGFTRIAGPLIESIELNKRGEERPKAKIVFIKAGREMHIVKADDICFAEITGRNITLYTRDKELKDIKMKFEDFIKYVNADNFVRCHKSFAVNTDMISELKPVNYRLWEVDFGNNYSGGKKCMMSKGYRENVTNVYFK